MSSGLPPHYHPNTSAPDSDTTQLNSSLLDLLVSNLSRLKESESDTTEDTDAQGVYSILGVFENLLSFLPPIADTIARDTTLISWLLKRIQKKEYDSNKQYAAEVLAIMLQSPVVVDVVGRLEGVEVLLGVVSVSDKMGEGDRSGALGGGGGD